jgi:deoxyribonuclease V
MPRCAPTGQVELHMKTEEKDTDADPALIYPVDRTEAEKIQEKLRRHCIRERTIDICEIRRVAGADASYCHDMIYAAVVVMTFPGLEVVEKTYAMCNVPFPYLPGLLAFREGPAILEAFSSLSTVPDLILINGHGYAHPKRFGCACHIRLILDIPSIGVAQHLLMGTAAEPGPVRDSTEPVLDNGEIIGMAVRTLAGAKPVFISAGHKVDLAQSVDIAVKTTTLHRITEPLWSADQASRQYKNRQSVP